MLEEDHSLTIEEAIAAAVLAGARRPWLWHRGRRVRLGPGLRGKLRTQAIPATQERGESRATHCAMRSPRHVYHAAWTSTGIEVRCICRG
jgi:hypothetical protein